MATITTLTTPTISYSTNPPIKIIDANRFSRFVKLKNSPEYDCLFHWVAWFRKRGIKAIVGLTHSGYAVYREGLISVPVDGE